jgi:hypothetical protein
MTDKMDWLATPETKRRFAEALWESMPDDALIFAAQAAALDEGTYDAYRGAVDVWRAAEPHPIHFISPEARKPLEERYEQATAERRRLLNRALGWPEGQE